MKIRPRVSAKCSNLQSKRSKKAKEARRLGLQSHFDDHLSIRRSWRNARSPLMGTLPLCRGNRGAMERGTGEGNGRSTFLAWLFRKNNGKSDVRARGRRGPEGGGKTPGRTVGRGGGGIRLRGRWRKVRWRPVMGGWVSFLAFCTEYPLLPHTRFSWKNKRIIKKKEEEGEEKTNILFLTLFWNLNNKKDKARQFR